MADKEPASLNGGIVKRRNRIPVSCESCRSRKLKCDRQKPACQNCKARDMEASCTYASQQQDSFKVPHRSRAGEHHGNGADEMGDRLHRLEALVSSMVKGGEGSPAGGSSADGPPAYPSVEGATEASAPYGGQAYVAPGGSQWQAILTDIAAMREHLEESRAVQPHQFNDAEQPALWGGVLRFVTRPELMGSLPVRGLADQLVRRFFDFYDPSMPYAQFTHRATFMKHYTAFWFDPDAWPVAKIGMLFSVFNLAITSYQRYGDEPPELRDQIPALADAWRHRAAQCIYAVNPSKPTFDSVLAIKMHLLTEYARPYGEADMTNWMLHGMLVRHAMRAGFHRDPTTLPGITPFEGEQRRRIWHSICQLDLLLSLQLGLPSMTRYTETDVAPPRSVYEEELAEGMAELPPARPPGEPTPVAYMIAKQRLFQTVGRVVEHLNSARPPADDAVLALNADVDAALAAVPPHLRHRPWEHSLADPPPLRLQRMQLQIFRDKVLCLLNRRFLAVPRTRARFQHSRSLCIQAALDLLSIQVDMHRMGVKWFAYTLNRNDFLLAAAILCRTLHTTAPGSNGNSKIKAESGPTGPEEVQIREALRGARAIWDQVADVSAEARPLCRIIDAMLARVPAAAGPFDANHPGSPVPSLESAGPGPSSASSSGPSPRTGAGGSGGSPDDVQVSDLMDWSMWDSLMQSNGFESFDNLDQLWAT